MSTNEEAVALEAIEKKYKPAVARGFGLAILIAPAAVMLDTQIMISVLIPITMVAGTAWFSVSLASMKKKFEEFGLELTLDLFTSFVMSLSMLLILTISSLTSFYWFPFLRDIQYLNELRALSSLMAIISVSTLIWYIFNGSLKYDINDSMLSGQNEAAERFYKRSLSILHKAAANLRENHSIQVANYSIGVSFYEVYGVIERNIGRSDSLDYARQRAETLILYPAMDLVEANNISLELIEEFTKDLVVKTDYLTSHKSYRAVIQELNCLKANHDEDQEMSDMRLSVVFEEIANLIEEFGDGLFLDK